MKLVGSENLFFHTLAQQDFAAFETNDLYIKGATEMRAATFPKEFSSGSYIQRVSLRYTLSRKNTRFLLASWKWIHINGVPACWEEVASEAALPQSAQLLVLFACEKCVRACLCVCVCVRVSDCMWTMITVSTWKALSTSSSSPTCFMMSWLASPTRPAADSRFWRGCNSKKQRVMSINCGANATAYVGLKCLRKSWDKNPAEAKKEVRIFKFCTKLRFEIVRSKISLCLSKGLINNDTEFKISVVLQTQGSQKVILNPQTRRPQSIEFGKIPPT